MISQPRMILVILAAIATLSCHGAKSKPSAPRCCRETSGLWSYWGEPREYVDGRWTYDFVLSYDARPVTVTGTLITPLGTFGRHAALDQWDASGWVQIPSAPTSLKLPGIATAVSDESLRNGFYASPQSVRFAGLPEYWTYWKDVRNQGWVDPSKLFDESFVREHPFEQSQR